MDKKYYYRMLGITSSDPTPKQIKQAYEQRMAKLNSEDYRDDRGYAQKKMNEASMAYKVLTGAAPAVSKGQKRERFEKFKDAVERKEGMESEGDRETERMNRGKFRPRNLNSGSAGSYDETPKSSIGGSTGSFKPKFDGVQKNGGKKFLTLIIPLIIVVISVAGTLFDNLFDFVSDKFNPYTYEEPYTEPLSDDDIQMVNDKQETLANIDYYAMLDTSTMADYAEYVDWDEGIDEYGEDEMFNAIFDLAYTIGLYNFTGFYDYVTGENEYYFYHYDSDCANTLVRWMNAPDFVRVAGATDLYTGSPILKLSDYLAYLETEVINSGYGDDYEYVI